MKTHFSCAELAALHLRGMPSSKKGWVELASREGWQRRERTGRGGGFEYELAALPSEVRDKITIHLLHVAQAQQQAEAEMLPATNSAVPVLQDLPQADRDCNIARGRIVNFVKNFPGSAEAAVVHLNEHRVAGALNAGMKWAFEHAWDKPRSNVLSRDTLNKWIKRHKQTGHYVPGKRQKDFSVRPWHAVAVALRKRPQGNSLTWLHDELSKNWQDAWGKTPGYDAVRRFFNEKFSQLDQVKGRYTGSQLRSHRFFQHRSREGLVPAQECHADGWNSHFTAPHPVTGEFVTYEIWHSHDVATRYVPEPGLGLTENYEVIAKCLENFIRELGVPLIFQVDSTKVVRGSDRFTNHPILSLEGRIGFTVRHPKEVGNSQANGIPENFNTTYLDKCSKELATYQNPRSMDELSFKRVKKLTADMVKAASKGDLETRDRLKREAERMGKGLVFESFQQAIDWIREKIVAYNDRPHRSLPKVRGADGKMRHQTPREALAEFKEKGWEPVLMGDTPEAHELALVDAFRPRAIVKVTRETVSPYGGMRFSNRDVLGHWNGKHVVVTYDIHEWRSVRVTDLDGEFICMAQFVEATGYRTQTAYEDAEEKRSKAQIRRREKQIDQIKARTPGAAIEAPKPSADHAQLVAEARRLHAEAGVIQLPAREVDEQVSQAPHVLETMTFEQKVELWDELDAAVAQGEPIEDERLEKFHKMFVNHTGFKALLRQRQEESQSGSHP